MTKTSKADGVRARVLRAACDLFYRQGYHATGINQIIEESGVAKASFYSHFPSKDELLLAYARETARLEVAELKKSIAALPTPAERFYGPLRVLIPWLKSTGFRGCPFQNLAAELSPTLKDVRKVSTGYRQEARRLMLELARDYLPNRKGKEKTDYESIATTYQLLFEGAIATAVALQSSKPIKDAETALRQFVGDP